ncbi:NFX1-type zinc finger-containing protein 1-like [Stegodyphus dumicola]|uniref:NFX1-type zinc finger-containing protein 1-like n=1 Tax=Stegodyphus dumicola TaxID=202533 RepID=UPI0015A99DAE|nr:NFX1-type zinc finger-containing protein 1-like [Stegodyphus dumicola]
MAEDELLSFCTKSCDTLLNCGHPCVGFCRWCFDIGIHAFCIEKCELMLPCGHKCQGYCGSPCPPCERKCYLSCPHGAYCINKCIRPCVECNENCVRSCDHIKCTNKCFEECTVGPCVVACSAILPCNHKCIGLCGDPCVCLECNNCEFSVGDNCVLLEDCEHIIEVNRLNEHIEICLFSFDWPNCPLCGVPVSNSRRYKTELLKAKKFVLKNCDTTGELSKVYYRFNSIFGSHCSVPSTFFDVRRKISEILKRDVPSSASLLILKNCIIRLSDLIHVSERLNEFFDEYLINRFETLLLWICSHLTNASFQQLYELEKAVKELINIIYA